MKKLLTIILLLTVYSVKGQTSLPLQNNIVTYTDSVFIDSFYSVNDFYDESKLLQSGYKAKDKASSITVDTSKKYVKFTILETSNNIMYSHLLTSIAIYYNVELYYYKGGYRYVISDIDYKVYDADFAKVIRPKAKVETILNPSEADADFVRYCEALRFAINDKMLWTVKNLSEALEYGNPPIVHGF